VWPSPQRDLSTCFQTLPISQADFICQQPARYAPCNLDRHEVHALGN
jgi:hypothetical protein